MGSNPTRQSDIAFLLLAVAPVFGVLALFTNPVMRNLILQPVEQGVEIQAVDPMVSLILFGMLLICWITGGVLAWKNRWNKSLHFLGNYALGLTFFVLVFNFNLFRLKALLSHIPSINTAVMVGFGFCLTAFPFVACVLAGRWFIVSRRKLLTA